MTGLILDAPGQHLYIRSVSAQGIQVGDRLFTQALLISGSDLRDDWPPQEFSSLQAAHLETIFELQPEVVLLGTGQRQHFLPPEMLGVFYRRGVGVEVMNTEAACRTFNVLVGDGRAAVAALLPLRA